MFCTWAKAKKFYSTLALGGGRERESCQHVKCQADNLLEVAETLAEG